MNVDGSVHFLFPIWLLTLPFTSHSEMFIQPFPYTSECYMKECGENVM